MSHPKNSNKFEGNTANEHVVCPARQAWALSGGQPFQSVSGVSVVQAVAKGDGVSLVGFGSFKSAARAAREGKNPKTGEKIKIPATTVPKFAAGATFKATVAAAKTKKKK